MRRRTLLTLPLLATSARAAVPPERMEGLRRGLNITNWFRFPPRNDPAAMRAYLADAEIARFRAWGFDYVRIAVQPEILRTAAGRIDEDRFAALAAGMRRLHAAGVGTMVELHPQRWRLESREEDRDALRGLWRALAPRLAPFDPARTFVEILNEPVFDAAPGDWHALQAELARIIRTALPAHTIIATGHRWSSLDGLLALTPLPDPNVVYTFHYYRPQFWTTLGSGVRAADPDAIARLPWPQTDAEACKRAGQTQSEQMRRQIAWHCGQRWDAAKLRTDLEAAAGWGRRHGVNVIANEIGVSARIAPAAREAYLRDLRAALEANGIGWALWGYDDSMGFARRKEGSGRVGVAAEVVRGLGLRG